MIWAALSDHLKGCVDYIDEDESQRLTRLRRKFFYYYLGSCGPTRFRMGWRDYFLDGDLSEGRRVPFVDLPDAIPMKEWVKVLTRLAGREVERDGALRRQSEWSEGDKENFDDEHG